MLNVFTNLTAVQRSLAISILSIILFILSASGSYTLFSQFKTGGGNGSLITALPGPATVVTEDPKEPKTEECPLNGRMHTKKAQESWVTRLPLAVMIENHTESRPQSGLSSADIIYEAVAEGGITRFMAVYYCNLGDIQIGPVRSARTYFLDWLSEYNALYAHVGGANTLGPADALGQIIKYGVKDLNQFSIGFPTFWRDYQRLGRSVATEHTMYSTTQKLWAIGAKKGWTNENPKEEKWEKGFVLWKFKDAEEKLAGTDAAKINVNFWQGYGDYGISWIYEPTCNCYKRVNGSSPHLDLNNKEQLSANNIIVQFEKESNANDGYENNAHLLYKTIGEGKALFFQDGKVIEGKWVKPSRLARTQYVGGKDQEIKFNRGSIWIQTVPEGANINY